MLPNNLAMSMPTDITGSSWQPAMDDPTISDPGAVTRLVLCPRQDPVGARRGPREVPA